MPYQKISIIFVLLVIFFIPFGITHAQDTPKPIRDAAIADLFTRVPGIGRPQGWQHVIITASDSNLGCGLLGTGTALPAPINVYIVTLSYPSAQYVYHVSEDAARVVACDAKLLQPAGTPPPTPLSTTCPNNALALSRLKPQDQASVAIQTLAVRQLASSTSSQVTALPLGSTVFILDGPDCDGQFLWWFVDYGGARGYMAELNYTQAQTYLTRVISVTPSGAAPQPSTGFQSNTCPPDFAGYLLPRLFVGATGRVESGGVNNIIRQSYGRSSQPTGAEMPPGSTFQVIGGPECTGANLGEAIVWWQVNYQGTIGWTAESLNGEYFLELVSGSPSVVTTAPTASLPTTRLPITTSNVARLSQVGSLDFGGAFPLMDIGKNGVLTVATTQVFIYGSVSASQLSSSRQITLEAADFYESLSPSGDLLATSDFTASQTNPTTQIVLWDTASGTERTRLPALQTGALHGVAISPDSSKAVVYYENFLVNPPSFTVTLYDLLSGSSIPLNHSSAIINAVYSPDGKLLATYSVSQDTVFLWDMTTLTQIGTLNADVIPTVNSGANAPAALAFSPDSTLLAVGGETGTVQIWDVAARTLKTTLTVYPPGQGAVLTIAFSPDGKLLAAAGGFLSQSAPSPNNQIALFDLATNALAVVLTGHTDLVSSLAFSPDGTLLFSAGDRTVRIWGVQ